MPSDESLSQQAEDFKAAGNAAFQKSDIPAAISQYSQGLVACDRLAAPPAALKSSLLSNRAMCYLKGNDFQLCVDDCTTALNLSDFSDPKLRSKVLYRRAKSRFMLANGPSSASAVDTNAALQDAAKDLMHLLQMDPSNKEANQLLQTVRAQHKMTAKATTPVSKTLQSIRDMLVADADVKKLQLELKRLMSLLDNDLTNAAAELGRVDGAVAMLMDLAATCTNTAAADDAANKTAVLALQCIRTASALPSFCRQYLVPVQAQLLEIVEKAPTRQSDIVVAVMSILVRLILHADRDDPAKDIEGPSLLDKTVILNILTTAWKTTTDKTVLRATLDVLSSFTAGLDRDATIRTALHIVGLSDSTVPTPKTLAETRAFTPKQLSVYRKRQGDKKTRDEAWAFERAAWFCHNSSPTDVNQSGLHIFLRAAIECEDHVVRREMTVALGRLLTCLDADDKIKEAVQTILGGPKDGKDGKKEEDSGMIIEEVYNEDEEEKYAAIEEVLEPLDKLMERAVVTAGLLLSRKEVGAWALSFGWENSMDDLPTMIQSGDPRAMCLVSEVISGASTVDSVRHIVANMMDSGDIKTLLMSDDRDIRSGAASAVAKLGMADKSTDEGELMGLLLAACSLLEDDGDEMPPDPNDKSARYRHFSSFSSSSVERAIEMINYLIANTSVKEELAAGFSATMNSPYTAMERLVKVADLPNVGESLTAYGLATIFQNMAVTNLEMRKEAFEGKEVTMEAYDEMQKMGKTEAEKEVIDSKVDLDTQELCNNRIKKMVSANVPRAMIAIMEGASEHTLEQSLLGLKRMASEPSVRGQMIQQGVLSACIKQEKNETPTETDTMKKVIRCARHTIAKILITTNPSLLTSAQRLGSIKPLIQLIRDTNALDLDVFEALMSVTNIASSGEDAKNRIVAERGIAALHYAMFSDHEMVQRAATEAMCNLVPHEAMMKHLAEEETLRLWLAFATEYENNYEMARAASGCLAMATQAEPIAAELVKVDRFKSEMTLLLECGRLEIMHRAFVILLNLVMHGGTCREKVVSEGFVAFCVAYVNSSDTDETLELEFSEEERALLPVTVEIAKKIVDEAE
jgi:hypothetical protein